MPKKKKVKSKSVMDIWSLIVRLRAGCCEMCPPDDPKSESGEPDRFGRPIKNLQAHHIIGRTNSLFKYDLNNGLSLCMHCHLRNKEWSPHLDAISTEGFLKRLGSQRHTEERYIWFEEHKHLKMNKNHNQQEEFDRLSAILDKMCRSRGYKKK